MLFNNDWEILHEVYKCKNITIAAKKLFISQPGLTKKLNKIEEELGVPIFIRTSSGTVFTPAGNQLMEYVERSIRLYQEMMSNLSHQENSLSGTLFIGADSSIVQDQLPQLIRQFMEQNPYIKLRLSTEKNYHINEEIYNQTLDVGFVRNLFNWNINAIPFRKEQAYLLSHKPVDLAELPSLPYISVERESINRMLIDNWWYDHFGSPPTNFATVHSGNECVALIKEGLGFSILINSCFVPDEGLFVEPLTFQDGTPATRDNFIIYNEKNSKTQLIQHFIDFSINFFGQQSI